jgi:hypothetical protein
VRCRRFAANEVRERRLDDDVCRAFLDDTLVVSRRRSARERLEGRSARERQGSMEVDAFRLHEGAHGEVRDGDDLQLESEVSEASSILIDELSDCAVDAAEADECEVVCAHSCVLLC